MAITTKAELQTAILNWLDRADDTALALRVPEFISLCEASIRRGLRSEFTFLPVDQDTTLLQLAPDLYLYGSLAHSAPYLEHDERIALWQAGFGKALEDLNEYLRNTAIDGAITDFASLLTAIGYWVGPSNLSGRSAQFIALAEAEIRRRVRRRTVEEGVIFLSAQASFDMTTLTTACQELRYVRLATSIATQNRPMVIGSGMMIQEWRSQHQSAGVPRRCGIIGTDLFLDPTPNADFNAILTYYEAILPVQQDVRLLIESPDLYLYGALLQAAPYMREAPMVDLWRQRFESAIQQINLSRQNAEHGGAPAPIHLPTAIG